MLDAYLYLGKRSPFGRYGGALSGVRSDDLLGEVIKSVVDEGPFNAEDIDDVIVGCGTKAVRMRVVSRATHCFLPAFRNPFLVRSCSVTAPAVFPLSSRQRTRSRLAKVTFSWRVALKA